MNEKFDANALRLANDKLAEKFARMNDADLLEFVRRQIDLTVSALRELAFSLAEAKKRGLTAEAVKDVAGIMHYLELVSAGQLLAEVLGRYMLKPAFEYIVALPLPEQWACVNGKKVRVYVVPQAGQDPDKSYVLKEPGELEDPRHIKQVFGKHCLRSDAEKQEIFRGQQAAHMPPNTKQWYGLLEADFEEDCCWFEIKDERGRKTKFKIPGCDVRGAGKFLEPRPPRGR